MTATPVATPAQPLLVSSELAFTADAALLLSSCFGWQTEIRLPYEAISSLSIHTSAWVNGNPVRSLQVRRPGSAPPPARASPLVVAALPSQFKEGVIAHEWGSGLQADELETLHAAAAAHLLHLHRAAYRAEARLPQCVGAADRACPRGVKLPACPIGADPSPSSPRRPRPPSPLAVPQAPPSPLAVPQAPPSPLAVPQATWWLLAALSPLLGLPRRRARTPAGRLSGRPDRDAARIRSVSGRPAHCRSAACRHGSVGELALGAACQTNGRWCGGGGELAVKVIDGRWVVGGGVCTACRCPSSGMSAACWLRMS